MNKPLLILFILIGGLAFGQNLVPNPSFEDYDDCPTAGSTNNDMQIEHCLGWYAPSNGTSDYYNACSNSSVNVPNGIFGYQLAKDGNGLVGIMFLLESGEPAYFEYVQTKLNAPLIQGKSYNFSFNVNIANNSDYAVEKIGAWFTSSPVLSPSGQQIFSTVPQIQNNTGFISDTLNWTKIEGEFTANGGEEYLSIGYYCDTLNVDTLKNSIFADPTSIFSYNYIDGLILEEDIKEVEIPNVITPNGDGVNEVFELSFTYSKVSILNRWGNLIWSGSNGEYWNGNTKDGLNVSEGTYFYIIETDTEKYQGFVQVIR